MNRRKVELREMIYGALCDCGGQKWLANEFAKNPAAAFTLLGKLVPSQVEATVEQHTTLTIEDRRKQAAALIEAAFAKPRTLESDEASIH